MKKILRAVALTAALTLTFVTPAFASADVPPPVPDEEAAYLDELLKIAGQPVAFTGLEADPIDGVTNRGFVPAPYNCMLYPSVVHLRTKSGEKRNVGAKPYTKCDKSVSAIKQVSSLYIVEWAGLYYRPMRTGVVANNVKMKSLNQQNVQYFCRNKNSSKYMQTTKGEITLKTRYFSQVSTAVTALTCGY